ncbi:MAG: lysophospholipid acyltransferase family protein [Hyphomonadaceae bacterium]
MNLIRSIVFFVWLYLSMAACASFGIPFSAFSQRGAIGVARMWARLTMWGARWIMGIKVVIEGRENIPHGASIMAMKHLSMMDTYFPFLLLDNPSVVLKQELSDLPIFGWHTQRSGAIPVARETHASALKKMLRRAREEIAKDREIFIFPEGTRQEIDAKPDYKPGVAALYRDLNVPVTPVATNTGLCWPAHGLVRRPGTVTVRILPAIPPGLSRDDFMQRLISDIETNSQALIARERERVA